MKNSAESYRIIPPLSILLNYDHMPRLLQANILITHKRNPRFKQSLYALKKKKSDMEWKQIRDPDHKVNKTASIKTPGNTHQEAISRFHIP